MTESYNPAMRKPRQTGRQNEHGTKPRPALVAFAVVFLAFAIAFVACFASMKRLVVTPDGVEYLATASSLVRGQGFTTGMDKPATTWMPLYPILLAGSMAVVRSMTAAAVVVNLLAIAAIFVLTWLLVRQWRGRVDWFTWFAAGATALSPAVLMQAMFALSEVAFAALVLLLVYAATKAETDKRWFWGVAVAGVAVALTRHIGILALAGVAVAWRTKSYWLALLPGAAATGLWILLAGTGDQLSGFSIQRGLDSVWRSLSGAAGMLGGWPMLGFVAVTLLYWRKLREVPTKTPLAALTFLLLTGLGGFFYVAGDLEGRMQLAAHVLLVPCLLAITAALLANHPFRWAVYAGFAVLIVSSAAHLWNPHTPPVGGTGFNTPEWRKRKALALVEKTPADVDIYTNAPDGVWFATGRVTYPLPRTDGRSKPKPHADKGGLVIYFKGLNRPGYVPPEFYNNRVLLDSAGKPMFENTDDALVVHVGRAQ
jgi:hypothetical protein